ncbi:MAG TPA: sigma 54-interacting transcriptional regulator [Firmicutes bacterium]|nr:sigma 54-interacting transcriptional regulator [Bacillota bacterium]
MSPDMADSPMEENTPSWEREREFARIEAAWREFIQTGNVDTAVVRPVIAESWRRSRAFGLDPYDTKCFDLADERELEARMAANKDLISTAWYFMEMLYRLVAGSGFRVDIADSDGFLLRTIGDEQVLKETSRVSFLPGASRRESNVGTNAIGLALVLDEPIQVVGAEHYNAHIHWVTCSAAPIHDDGGRIIGVLNMTGRRELVHKHTLGIVAGMSEAIERELALKRSMHEIRTLNRFLKTVFDSMSDGLVAVAADGVVTRVNRAALRIFGMDPREVVGRPLGEGFGLFPSVLQVFKQSRDQEFREHEISIRTKGGTTRCLVTTRLLRDADGNPIGTLAIFNRMDRVRSLVHRMVGAHARFTFDDIVGRDPALLEAIKLARAAAGTGSRILLQGESGTGKELFAQAIHNESARREGPFVAINCAAVPTELIESEFFGYEEGAFTGARRGGKPGKFELAEGGTLFLDEVESMPLEMQAKLLRVLEDSQMIRVGGTEVIPVDVRVIAATNRDLLEEVRAGRFREDLYYRLNVVNIKIPPLRERARDIPLLVDHFLERLRLSRLPLLPTHEGGVKISQEALDVLSRYHFPGNVRELQNILERAVIAASGNASQSGQSGTLVVTVECLPRDILQTHATAVPAAVALPASISAPPPARTGDIVSQDNLPQSIEQLEKGAILEALKACNGNISRAAQLLGIGRNTLYRKLKKFCIARGECS